MSSAEHLKRMLEPDSSRPERLTLEQHFIDLGWHQKGSQGRSSFVCAMKAELLDGDLFHGC